VPIWFWRDCDRQIAGIKSRYGLLESEIHAAWMLRKYLEQKRIPNFDSLRWEDRRSEVERLRRAELLRLQSLPSNRPYQQTKKNYAQTQSYVHLTLNERKAVVLEIADAVADWGFARLFAECIDKVHFDPRRATQTVDEQAFEQVVSRFEQYLQATQPGPPQKGNYGLLIHDNNETVASRHTKLMREFHRRGTLWTGVQNIIETPLFVDSQLTGMVQMADLCAYGIRRYLENNETEIFKTVFRRADRRNNLVVGVRHFTRDSCTCEICSAHRMR